jgi:signal transduction histidine kinase/CheY-like chemotaxis protein
MGKKLSTRARRPVLVCMARKEDIPAIRSVLNGQSADAAVCLDIPALCRKISDQVEAAILGAEMLSEKTCRMIAEVLDAQPEWSDLPILLSVSGGAGSSVAINAIRDLGNVFVLDHPFTPAALENTLLIAFRSRQRQRWVRDLMKECEHAVQTLQESQNQLEQRVEDRTSELAEKALQLRRFTGELILSEQRERQHLARMLHDHLLQLLVSAKYRIVSLNRTEDPAVKIVVQEVEELLDEVIAASRSLASELSPPIIRESGLRTGMEWLVSFMAARDGLSVQLHMNEDFSQLDENTKILLFDSVRELLLNAARHGRVRSAEVHVRRAEGNMLEVAVVDRGTGFNPASMKHEGTGLLRIRHRLELIGGHMEIESAPRKGSRFAVIVPLAETAIAPFTAEAGLQSEEAPPRRDKPVSGMIRILIVDDHAIMRQGLLTSLSQEPDIAIVGEAANGKIALEKARSLQPDVILMDLGMPKMNGIEATRIIHSEMPKVRVIGLSMFEERERANAMFEAGAIAYLTKTCSMDAITSAIRRSLGKPGLSAG